MKVLDGATGYVRRLLAERLGLRSAPEIRFVFDPSIEYGIRLEELLQSEKERSHAGDDDRSASQRASETAGSRTGHVPRRSSRGQTRDGSLPTTSSRACVASRRKRRCGHTGTLDPFATGLLGDLRRQSARG